MRGNFTTRLNRAQTHLTMPTRVILDKMIFRLMLSTARIQLTRQIVVLTAQIIQIATTILRQLSPLTLPTQTTSTPPPTQRTQHTRPRLRRLS